MSWSAALSEEALKTPCRFSRNEKFEVADLLDYLAGKSVLQTQHAAMAPAVRGIPTGYRRPEFAKFQMT